MKRFLTLTLLVAALAAFTTPSAHAQEGLQFRVMDFNSWSTNSPTADSTNQVIDQVIVPKAVQCFNIQPPASTVTVYTVACGVATTVATAVTDAKGNGSAAVATATNAPPLYILKGDLLARNSSTATNGTVRLISLGQ